MDNSTVRHLIERYLESNLKIKTKVHPCRNKTRLMNNTGVTQYEIETILLLNNTPIAKSSDFIETDNSV